MRGNLIAGRWVQSNAVFPVTDPATGDEVDRMAEGSAEDVDRAVAAAQAATTERAWIEDAIRRSRVLLRWADKVERAAGAVAELLTRENGKILVESRAEVASTVDALRFAAGQARTLEGRSLTLGPGLYGDVVPEPLGVVALIVPWNWPLLLMMRELAPALAAGNAVVIKPASYTPLAVAEVIRIGTDDAELPAGIVNLVAGPGRIVGEALVAHAGVNAISFTGDTATGRRIMERAASGLKKVLLELGGKSPNILFPDAPLEKAIPTLVRAMFVTSGQNCMTATRILVHQDIYEQAKARFIEQTQRLRVGPGLDPASMMGPVIAEDQLERIADAVHTGQEDGGTLVTGGQRLRQGDLARGYFFAPTILEHVPLNSRMVQQEIFGPVISLEAFGTEEQAIRLANGTEYGLVAGVWTRDHARAERVARQIQAGTVWINTYLRTFAEAESGGMKASGIGRSRGRAGLYEYTALKHILSDINE